MDGETPLDRIRARSSRLETKKSASSTRKDTAKADALGGLTAAPKSSGKAMARVADGMSNLDAKKSRTIEAVTTVRLEADKRERDRRAMEDEKIQDRLHRLREEAAASGRANAAVQLKWSDILERNLPQELAAELGVQRESCDGILRSKDELISELDAEMKIKDEEYVKSLQQQRDDIEKLIAKMTGQFSELSAAYEAELDAMEGAFMQERDELLSSNKKEIDALFEARRSMETRFVEERLAREEAYARELSDMQAADAENYQKLKVKLETDVQILEQQLENMKFTYLLNTEKLEYNYRVLTERDSENKQTLAGQKQRLARLRAALSKVQAEYESSDAKFKNKNAALTEEYTRITKQYRDLQSKFRHFEASDAARYSEIVAMHKEEMGSLAERLLAADRVITEQLLGWQWVPPALPAAAKPSQAASMLDMSATAAKSTESVGLPSPSAPAAASPHATTASFTFSDAVDAQPAPDPDLLRAVVGVIHRTCSQFLLDASVLESAASMEAAGQPEVAAVIRANAIFAALNCTTNAHLNSLVDAIQVGIANAAAEVGEGSEAYSLLYNDPETGSPKLPQHFNLVACLRSWLEASQGSAGGDVAKKLKTASEADSKRKSDKHLPSMKPLVAEDLEYWDRVANTIPAEKIRIWKALERALTDYKGILSSRSKLMDDCNALESENAELRKTLATYLSPTFNSMQIPPAQTVVLGPAAAASLAVTLDPDTVALQAKAAMQAAAPLRVSGPMFSSTGIEKKSAAAPAPKRPAKVDDRDAISSLSLTSSPPPRSAAATRQARY